MRTKALVTLSLLFIPLSPFFILPASRVSAHEVYVLTPQEIAQAVSMPSPNPFSVIPLQELRFLIWGAAFAVLALVSVAFSVSTLFERVLDPLLLKLKKYAPLAGRLTLGGSLLFSGWHHGLFGPELPLSGFAGSFAGPLSVILLVLGALVIVGFLTRPAALAGIGLFIWSVVAYHLYMLTYVNYLGEMILVLILGGGMLSIDGAIPALGGVEKAFAGLKERFEPYAFLILRILFGTAVFFASFYAKFLHSNLALDTVADYHLTSYFHFTPLFLVLGAFIVEALLGLCFALGFEVRLAALVFTFFLTLSILFFGEAVWPHLILFGVNIALFLHGYDKYTLEAALFERKRHGEPIF